MNETALNTQPLLNENKKKWAFLIPAVLILPEILWTIIINLMQLSDYAEEIPALSSYTESFISYINTSALSCIIYIIFHLLSIIFVVGCVIKANGGKYKSLIKAFFAIKIAFYVIRFVLNFFITLFYNIYMSETFNTKYHSDLIFSLVDTAGFLFLTTIFIILLISEIKESNALRIASIICIAIEILLHLLLIIIGIINCFDAFESMVSEEILQIYIQNIISYVTFLCTHFALLVYQLLSFKKKQTTPTAPQPVSYVPVAAPVHVPYAQPVHVPYQQPVQMPAHPVQNYAQPIYQQPAPQVAYTPVQQPQFTTPQNSQEINTQHSDNTQERLEKIKTLLDKGIITQAEYDEKRAEIIKDI